MKKNVYMIGRYPESSRNWLADSVILDGINELINSHASNVLLGLPSSIFPTTNTGGAPPPNLAALGAGWIFRLKPRGGW